MPLFQGFPEEDLVVLAQRFRSQVWAPQQTLCEAGAQAHVFYVVIEGQVDIFSPGTEPVLLNTLGPGDFLGEVGLLTRAQRSASAVTRTRARLLALDEEDFHGLLLRHAEVVQKVSFELARRLAKLSQSRPVQDRPPEMLADRYRIRQTLGRGGMATVFLVRDERLGVDRALKLLLPRFADRKQARQRFDTEARTMASLKHPHILTVHDVSSTDDQVFLVMEVAAGGSLADRLRRRGALGPRQATEILLPVLDALHAAHAAGVIHRDVKPGNILINADGVPLLTDFGIARVEAEADRTALTQTGLALGTRGFMAPEQRKEAHRVDGRADVYATGATLATLITAEPPLELFAPEARLELGRRLPEPLLDVVTRATRYHPADRYPSAAAMADALRAVLPLLPPDPSSSMPLLDPDDLLLGSTHGVDTTIDSADDADA